MQRRILILVASLLLLAISTGIVFAAPAAQTVVEDEVVVRNDVVIFDDNFELAEGGRVNGDVIIFNGNAHIAGTVTGDVVLFNGNLTVDATASLNGDCVLFNGHTSGEGTSNITCDSLQVMLPNGVVNFVTELATEGDLNFDLEPTVEVERPSFFSRFVGGTAAALGRSLLFGLLAFAAASLVPRPMMRIEEAMRAKPVASGDGWHADHSSPMPIVVTILALFFVSLVLILACGIGPTWASPMHSYD